MNAPALYPAHDQRRRSMVAKVKIAQKELQIDDGAYRAMLLRLTGRESAAECDEAQLGLVLDEFKAKGWKPRLAAAGGRPAAPRRAAGADSPVARKARALWISLHQLGVVRDPSEAALESFAKRQLGCERLQWADQGLAYRLVEALKAMARREGWDAAGGDDVRAIKASLVGAMWARLGKLGAIKGAGPPVYDGLANWAMGRRIIPGLRDHHTWTEQQLDAAIGGLAAWIAARTPEGAQ